MAIRAAQSAWADEPTKTTPLNASRLNYAEGRASDIVEEVERMIAGGARTPGAYGVTGNGVTDDTVNMNAFLAACKENAGVVPPGAYKITAPLKVPVAADIAGTNIRTTRFLRQGNGNLFEMEGDSSLRNLFVEATAEQASGNAFDFTAAGGGDNVRLDSIMLSNNFFNGFFLVPTTEGGSLVVTRIRVSAPGAGITGTKGAVFVLGNTANRLINAVIEGVAGVAANRAGVAKWMEINNTDSCELDNFLLQTGTKGVLIGNNDTSANRTTGLKMSNFVVDGGGEGYDQSFTIENAFGTDFASIAGQGGETFFGQNVKGFTWVGGALQVCVNNGLRFGGAAAAGPIVFQGVKIGGNNTAKNLEASALSADIQFEPGCGHILFNGCPLGNVFNYGGTTNALYAAYFPKTGRGEKIAFLACPFTKSGALKALFKYEWEKTQAENKIYGLEAGNPIPVPWEW